MFRASRLPRLVDRKAWKTVECTTACTRDTLEPRRPRCSRHQRTRSCRRWRTIRHHRGQLGGHSISGQQWRRDAGFFSTGAANFAGGTVVANWADAKLIESEEMAVQQGKLGFEGPLFLGPDLFGKSHFIPNSLPYLQKRTPSFAN